MIDDCTIEIAQGRSAIHNLKPCVLQKGEAIGRVHAEMDDNAAHWLSILLRYDKCGAK
jgi:hypothetical protein